MAAGRASRPLAIAFAFAFADRDLAVDLGLLSDRVGFLAIATGLVAGDLRPDASEHLTRPLARLPASSPQVTRCRTPLIVEAFFALIRGTVALISKPLALIGKPLALVRDALPLRRDPFALVGGAVALIRTMLSPGQPALQLVVGRRIRVRWRVTFSLRRNSVHGRSMTPADEHGRRVSTGVSTGRRVCDGQKHAGSALPP